MKLQIASYNARNKFAKKRKIRIKYVCEPLYIQQSGWGKICSIFDKVEPRKLRANSIPSGVKGRGEKESNKMRI